ncbi:MAG: PorV/PorQ family protein, partial [Calditrichales bacterium]
LHMAEMEVTTEFHPTGNGEYFSYYDTFGAFTYALKMTEQFSFGASLKFVQEGMADLSMTGWMIDVGTFYWTGFRNLRFAVGLSNFGPDMHPDGKYLKLMKDGEYSDRGYESFSPPTTFRVGAAMGVLTGESYDLTTSFQINHPVDNAENAVIGLDFCYIDNLHLRAGYRINYDEERLTFGAGFKLPVQTLTFSLDYAYKDFNNLGSTHQFTFNFQF